MRVERLVVVGTGLIGGSVIAALRHVGAVGEVVGLGRAGGTVTRARELGLVDRAETDPARALA
ncbi:MAG: prephenate dehydrogenase/arogenate dehydrogenase family protein, partial [Thiohalospira sp.]